MPVCKNKKEELRKKIINNCDFDNHEKDCRRILTNLDNTPAGKCHIFGMLEKGLSKVSGGTDRPYIAPTKTKGFLKLASIENPEEEVEEKDFGDYKQGGRRRRRKSRRKRTKKSRKSRRKRTKKRKKSRKKSKKRRRTRHHKR